jgi:hypothetical protein
MDPEVTRNQNYDDHYANDSKDVHSGVLTFNNDGGRCSYALPIPAIKPTASFRNRWLVSTEARQVQVSIITSACTPNIRLLRRAEGAPRR